MSIYRNRLSNVNNIHNEAYLAPSYAKKYQSVDIDDDIPF